MKIQKMLGMEKRIMNLIFFKKMKKNIKLKVKNKK